MHTCIQYIRTHYVRVDTGSPVPVVRVRCQYGDAVATWRGAHRRVLCLTSMYVHPYGGHVIWSPLAAREFPLCADAAPPPQRDEEAAAAVVRGWRPVTRRPPPCVYLYIRYTRTYCTCADLDRRHVGLRGPFPVNLARAGTPEEQPARVIRYARTVRKVSGWMDVCMYVTWSGDRSSREDIPRAREGRRGMGWCSAMPRAEL